MIGIRLYPVLLYNARTSLNNSRARRSRNLLPAPKSPYTDRFCCNRARRENILRNLTSLRPPLSKLIGEEKAAEKKIR